MQKVYIKARYDFHIRIIEGLEVSLLGMNMMKTYISI